MCTMGLKLRKGGGVRASQFASAGTDDAPARVDVCPAVLVQVLRHRDTLHALEQVVRESHGVALSGRLPALDRLSAGRRRGARE